MVPRIGGQGRSFKGAALYYLHDRGHADTDRRVAFTHTENSPTDDPEMAWRWMARTAMDAEERKRQTGHNGRGQKSQKPVFTMSLSWAPDEQPDQAHMIDAMRGALAALGLQDRQALFVGHSDTAHPHLHSIVCLTDPQTGRTASLKFSKEKLSRWAQAYEEQHGIRIEQRRRNNAERDRQGQERERRRQAGVSKEKAAYPRPAKAATTADLKAEITKRYLAAKDGAAFQRSMAELGFTIAQGRRVVFVDPQGKEHSLARHIDGPMGKAAVLRKKLAGLDLPTLDMVRARQVPQAEPDRRPSPRGRRLSALPSPLANALQDRQIADRATLSDRHHQARLELEADLDRAYSDAPALRQRIAQREQRMQRASAAGRWLLKTFTKHQTALENDRRTLASLEQRRTEARGAFEAKVAAERAQLERRHQAANAASVRAVNIEPEPPSRARGDATRPVRTPPEAPRPSPTLGATEKPKDSRREYVKPATSVPRRAEGHVDHDQAHDVRRPTRSRARGPDRER